MTKHYHGLGTEVADSTCHIAHTVTCLGELAVSNIGALGNSYTCNALQGQSQACGFDISVTTRFTT